MSTNAIDKNQAANKPKTKVIASSSANPKLEKDRDGKVTLIVRDLTLRLEFDGDVKPQKNQPNGNAIYSAVDKSK